MKTMIYGKYMYYNKDLVYIIHNNVTMKIMMTRLKNKDMKCVIMRHTCTARIIKGTAFLRRYGVN